MNRVVLWARNGRTTGSAWVAASRVGGVSEIVSWMKGRATCSSAVKVVSSETNSCAWVSATGATSREVAASA